MPNEQKKAETCPMCPGEALKHMACPKCQREWYWMEVSGESLLASKKRKVRITAPIEAGKRLDDCIEPSKAAEGK